jgi:hypothetical protein
MDEFRQKEEQDEKRAMRRFSLQLPVTVSSAAGAENGAMAESRDLSSQGICFYCEDALEANAPIEFTVILPAEITMSEPLRVRCTGTVVRVEHQRDPSRFAVAAAINSYEFVAEGEPRAMLSGADAPPAL